MHREKRRVIHPHYVDIDALNALRCDFFCCTYLVNFTRLLFPRDFLCENVCLSRLGTWSSGSEYTLRPFQFRTSNTITIKLAVSRSLHGLSMEVAHAQANAGVAWRPGVSTLFLE